MTWTKKNSRSYLHVFQGLLDSSKSSLEFRTNYVTSVCEYAPMESSFYNSCPSSWTTRCELLGHQFFLQKQRLLIGIQTFSICDLTTHSGWSEVLEMSSRGSENGRSCAVQPDCTEDPSAKISSALLSLDGSYSVCIRESQDSND